MLKLPGPQLNAECGVRSAECSGVGNDLRVIVSNAVCPFADFSYPLSEF